MRAPDAVAAAAISPPAPTLPAPGLLDALARELMPRMDDQRRRTNG